MGKPIMAAGHKRDPLWEYFNEVPLPVGKIGMRAKCKQCNKEIQGLVAHIRRSVPSQEEAALKIMKETCLNMQDLPCYSQHRDFSIMSEPITLNVGGKLYTTSLSTLTSFPDSMLGAMFSGKMPTKRDSQGYCFIDRDGKVFRYILNFLRTSHLDLPEDFQEMGLLRREADFYQVQPLIEALQEKEVELSKAEKNAMLNITLDQRTQTVHFTVREAPQIYSLSSSSMEVFNAHIFSTSSLFLKLLGSRLYYCFNGNLSSISSYLQDPNHLTLDWVATVEGLPEEEYTRQNLKRLWVVPANTQINSFQVFVEEVLKIAMSDGFCVDSSHPHASDFMNNKIIRLIRYK
ncbi:BTB/POZ domain-containing protein KCTD21 isoform X1 [Chrysemys picta bellii]|uniref:BTB/POZ domain-containing protein KCTD21 isoform X1 n=2 Tax=Chrysemys picta bellii TaxID=8478 RepID=UPI0032B12FBD